MPQSRGYSSPRPYAEYERPLTIRTSSSSFANASQPIYYPPTPTNITTTSPPWFGPSVAVGAKLDDVWELVPSTPRSRSSPSSRSSKRPRTDEQQEEGRFEGSRLPVQPIDQDLFFPLGTPSSADFAPLSSRRALGRVPPPRIRPPPSSSHANLPIPLAPIGLGLSIPSRQPGPYPQYPPPQQRPSMVVEPRISGARRVGVGAGGGGRPSFEGMQEGYRAWAEDAAARREFEQGLFREAGMDMGSSSSSWTLGQQPSSHPLLEPPHFDSDFRPPSLHHPNQPLPFALATSFSPPRRPSPQHQSSSAPPPQQRSLSSTSQPRRTLETSSVGRPDSLSPPSNPVSTRRSVSAEATRLPSHSEEEEEEDEEDDPFAMESTPRPVPIGAVSPPPTFSGSTTIRCPEQLCSFAALEMEVIARHLRTTHGQG